MPTSLGVDRACWQAFPDEILGVVDGQHRSIVWGLRRVQERRFVRRLPPVLAGKIDGGGLPGDGGAVTLPMAFAYVEAYAAALVPARQGVPFGDPLWDGPKQGSAADQRQIRAFLMRFFERALIPAPDREKFPTCPGTCLETARVAAQMIGGVVAVPRRRPKEES